MPKRVFEHKILPIFVTKVDGDLGVVDAVVSVFGILDGGGDVIENGAFTKTIVERGRKVRVLDAHNSWSLMDVIGKPLEMREIGREELPPQVLEKYPEATGGLLTKTQFLMDTPEGAGAFARIKADAVNEYSIGYETLTSTYREITAPDGKKVNARILKEIRLWEYSPVVWGMNPATATVGAKSAKEMTPQGPITRLGDYVQGRMRYVANACANEMLMYGKLSSDEHGYINVALEAAMKAFVAALPEDTALTPVSRSYGFYYDNADAPDTHKESPAPADPSAALLAMVEEMQRAMKTAGLLTDAAPAPAAAPSVEPPKQETPIEPPPQAGSDASKEAQPPTDEDRKRLLAEIEGAITELPEVTT